MTKENPLEEKDIKNGRLDPQMESDSFAGVDKKAIVKKILEDMRDGRAQMATWLNDRALDIAMYEGAPPSQIENLDKESWQSDRNLGLTSATCDQYQATLLSTCFNPDTIHFIANEENDFDRRDNITKFAKWMVSPSECNIFPEIDDFIHNRITQGVSIFKGSWRVWYEWVDLRIPRYSSIVKVISKINQNAGEKVGKFLGYDIKTVHKRFERACLENIDNLEDIVLPTFGSTLEEKPFIIHVIHKTPDALKVLIERSIFKGVDDDFFKNLKGCIYDKDNIILKEKSNALGLSLPGSNSLNFDNVPLDILEWYGTLTIGGKTERFRCHVEPITETLLSIKPLRKITRSGKYPFRGGALIRRPGFFQGRSLPRLIAPISNAYNNIWNQKSDFQYIQNVPFGFMKPDENYQKQTYKIKPGDIYPSDDPSKVYFPNLSRSMAWAQIDFSILQEMLEKVTGVASYFMTNQANASGTATRDVLINQKSETRFSLWVSRIIEDICSAIIMLLEFYQDWAPPDLGERILGDNGKRLFEQFTLESIRGGYDVRMTPDIISGSKTLERQIAIWGLEVLQNTVWFNPQINPRGNWQLVKNAAKTIGVPGIDNIMPPQPPAMNGQREDVKAKWQQIAQGEIPEVKPTDDAISLVAGLDQLKSEKYYELSEEVRPNLDKYMFDLSIAMIDQVKRAYQDMMANQLAQRMIMEGPNVLARGVKNPDEINVPGKDQPQGNGELDVNSRLNAGKVGAGAMAEAV